ncbi:MAG TPA: translocation/assembly module TamB domain-containing protein, partial [Sediminibacterium sp.]|nr:translocation/assembly module TamB domain-containing protein [Sediminibacterium sp.]
VIIPEPEASKWPVVEDKLSQLRLDESEINKQVFALLILGRFIGEDITQNNTGTTTTGTMMRQSVSGILTDQLNKVASGLIKGVDINVGIESQDDYSSGTAQTRTDLRVGLSRSMNNDRIKVNVGTNVPLEGANSAPNASIIAGDVTVDYLLSKDGRYMLRTYSKNSYEGVVEGQIIETGLTFVITLEYDHWREIFRKKAALEKAEKNKNQSAKKSASKQ